MEPLNDDQLNQALRQWQAPGAPASLVLPRRRWWQWLFTGSVRVPVPLTAAAIGLTALTRAAISNAGRNDWVNGAVRGL